MTIKSLNSSLRIYLIALTGLSACLTAGTLQASDVPLMPNTRQAWIAKNIELDGVPASIRSIYHRDAIEQVTAYYQQAWSRYGPVHTSKDGQQQIIAAQHRKKFVSLQLESGANGTYGVLIISEPPIPGTVDEVQLPLPENFIVLNTQTHRDGSDNAQTITLHSNHSVERVSAELVNQWRTHGWTLLRKTPFKHSTGGREVRMRKGKQHLLAYIAQDKRWNNSTLAFVIRKTNGADQ